MKTLYFDLDGVLADFHSMVYERIPQLKHMEPGSKESGDIIDHFCQNEMTDIFRHLQPFPGVIDAFHILDKHYNLYFLSTPMWEVPQSYMDKRIWVENHFGKAAYKKLILCHNKSLLIGDYLIDDRTKNGAGEFKGMHIHYGQKGFETMDKVIEFLRIKDNW